MPFHLTLNKNFYPNPQPLTYRRLKQLQRTKINKTMLSALFPPHSSVSHTKFTISELKSNQYSILTVNELVPPVLESSARISKFYAPTDYERKFNKTEFENWLPIGYNLWSSCLGTAVINSTLCSPTNGFIYPSIKSWNNHGKIFLPWNCRSVLKSHTPHPE